MGVSRGTFLASAAAGLIAGGALRARAAEPYEILGEIALNGAGTLRLLNLRPERGRVPVQCTAAILSRTQVAARIVNREIRGNQSPTVAEIARENGALVAINGGYFTDAYAPDGLLVVDGRTIAPARSDYSDVVAIDRNGSLSIVSPAGARGAYYAVQGKPSLVGPGGTMGMHREVGGRARRTFVAQGGDSIVVATTSEVTLYHLANVLVEYPDAFGLRGIDAAVNLSGDATSGMYVALPQGGEAGHAASWVNRDFLVFSPRRPGTVVPRPFVDT
jgi:hypothetical protein